MLTLEQLRNPPTREEAFSELEALLVRAGFPATAWQSGGIFRSMIEMAAEVYFRIADRASTISKIYFNETSSGEALTELSKSHFDNERAAGVRTVGSMVVELTDLTEGPYNVAVGDMRVSDGEHEFTNVAAFTLTSAAPIVTSSFIAAQDGVSYNVENRTTWTLVTPFESVEVTNPSANWITTLGVNEENDTRLKYRNSIKWATLGCAETTSLRVQSLVLSASTDVRYVYVDDTNPRGAGTVDVYISGETNILSGSVVDAVSGTVKNAFFGPSTRISVASAVAYPLFLTGTVYYSPAYSQGVVEEVLEAAVTQFIADNPIGGTDFSPGPSNIVSVNDLINEIEETDGVKKVSLSSPAVDIELDVDQKLTLHADTFAGLNYVKTNK